MYGSFRSGGAGPDDSDDDPFGDSDGLLQNGWIVPSIDSPSTTWVGANPEPDALSLRIGRTSMVTSRRASCRSPSRTTSTARPC